MSWEFGIGTIEIDYELPTDVAPNDYPDDEPMPMPMVALAAPDGSQLTGFKVLAPGDAGWSVAEFHIDFWGAYDSILIRLSDDVPVVRRWFRWACGVAGMNLQPDDIVVVRLRL